MRSGQALPQQDFQSSGVALFSAQLLAQADELQRQRIVVALQLASLGFARRGQGMGERKRADLGLMLAH